VLMGVARPQTGAPRLIEWVGEAVGTCIIEFKAPPGEVRRSRSRGLKPQCSGTFRAYAKWPNR
jgi:hypothetical protein